VTVVGSSGMAALYGRFGQPDAAAVARIRAWCEEAFRAVHVLPSISRLPGRSLTTVAGGRP
jgi:hypothetical protein